MSLVSCRYSSVEDEKCLAEWLIKLAENNVPVDVTPDVSVTNTFVAEDPILTWSNRRPLCQVCLTKTVFMLQISFSKDAMQNIAK